MALASSSGLASPSFAVAATPAPSASLREMKFTLTAEDYSAFSEVMQAARQASRTLVDQAFEADPAVETVIVHGLAEGAGTVVPLGLTRVTRTDWRSQPDIDRWSQWFEGFAQALLGFGPTVAEQPAAGASMVAEGSDRVSRGRSSRVRHILSQSN